MTTLVMYRKSGSVYLRSVFRRPKPSGDNRGEGSNAAATLRPVLYGNLPVAQWGVGASAGNPWDRFAAARVALDSSDQDAAVAIWTGIAATPGLESRHYLQAWTFLRHAGHQPPAGEAKRALGVVAEMPVNGGLDVLAAYEDGSCRYLNHSGAVTVIEDGSVEAVHRFIRDWLDAGRSLAGAIGPWEGPELPDVPPGDMRIMVLTPSGPHFGQGPPNQIMADPLASDFVGSATALLLLIVSLAVPPSTP